MSSARRSRMGRSRWAAWHAFTLTAALLACALNVRAESPANPENLKFFEAQVRPLLVEKCLKCHGPDKQKGGLRLDSKTALLAGGESGPVIAPGDPHTSLLVDAIEYKDLEMPPEGQLTPAQREVLTRWVEMGAPWPGGGGESGASGTPAPRAVKNSISDEDRAFWSFQPLKRPPLPDVADSGWVRNPVDRFILERLHAADLTPAPEADRRTLIRRLTFDLWGLPPTPEAIAEFLADESPDAYEKLVDRLLASPRYGERWARHWLDLVRYAESDGYRQDAYRPDAWRYRDYVIRALNEDRPYSTFLREQIAGDELDPANPEMKVAVGFYRLGTYEFNQRDVIGQWNAILNDITDVVGDVFLGLGMSCARCHDHKFDPILQRDYYRLQAFFTPIYPRDDLDLASADRTQRDRSKLAAWEARTAEIRREIASLEKPFREKVARSAIDKFPDDIKAILTRPAAERTPREQQLAALAYRQVTVEIEPPNFTNVMKKSAVKGEWEALQKKLAEHEAEKPVAAPRVMTVTDVGPEAPPTIIAGDRSKTPIEPGVPTIFDPEPTPIERPAAAPTSTGRRSALAEWMTRSDNPLTTRVIVNRLWQYHFGRGLVATASDFGRLGERPSHPELLDWLATEFVARGWSLKQMHRLLLTSAAYRESSHHASPESARRVDPENRLLWRAPVRRLEIEPIRDAMLTVSGELNAAVGGPSVEVAEPRRAVYAKVRRNTVDPMYEAFDAPDGSISTPQRNATVTPIQSLLMVNGGWTLDRARAFATRIHEAGDSEGARIQRAFQLAFGREPEPEEQADALEFLRRQADRVKESTGKAKPKSAPDAALTDFCHTLLNTSEFLYVD